MAEIQPPQSNLSLIFCLIGDKITTEFLCNFSNIMAWCAVNNINTIISSCDNNGTNLSKYNSCLEGHNNNIKGLGYRPFNGEIHYDYIIFINTELRLTKEKFCKLLLDATSQPDKQVVSATLVKNNDVYSIKDDVDNNYVQNRGQYGYMTLNDIHEFKHKPKEGQDETRYMEIEYTKLDCIIIKGNVFDKFLYPWFQPIKNSIHQTDEHGVNREVAIYYSDETFYFCKVCSKLNISIYIDTDVIVTL